MLGRQKEIGPVLTKVLNPSHQNSTQIGAIFEKSIPVPISKQYTATDKKLIQYMCWDKKLSKCRQEKYQNVIKQEKGHTKKVKPDKEG
jgi:hypothetical protein